MVMISQDSDEIQLLVDGLTDKQLSFVHARCGAETDAEAADAIHLAAQTCYNWPNKQDVDKVVIFYRHDMRMLALEKLRRSAGVAVDALLDVSKRGRNERARVAASNSMLNRVNIPEQRGVDVTTAGRPIPSLAEILAGIHASSPDSSSQDDGSDDEGHDFGY